MSDNVPFTHKAFCRPKMNAMHSED